ncbi:MAG: hypothetical protein RBR22_11635 [Desulfuromonas sp.]|nr:hypothetical protein [Desulfuromonas sp.]
MNTVMRTLCAITLSLLIVSCGSNVTGEAEYNKGIEAINADKIELAQKLFIQATQINPQLAEAHINLGLVYIKTHQLDKAWDETQKGLNIINTSKSTIVRGSSWQEQAALANNNLAKIVFDKAIHARKSGDLIASESLQKEALTYLKTAIEMAPENELIQKNISYIERWPN